MGLALRRAADADRALIARWLAAPELESWWADRASAEAEISLALSSTAALARILEEEREPIGYGQAVEIGLLAGPQPASLAPGSWTVALCLASRAHRDRGLACAGLALLVEEVFATTLAVACCALVPVSNEATARVYERARFRWRQVWNDPARGPAWVMVRERSP